MEYENFKILFVENGVSVYYYNGKFFVQDAEHPKYMDSLEQAISEAKRLADQWKRRGR